eukprot:tig00000949_g5742.t1
MLVPWTHWGEWQLVHRSLFSNRNDLQHSALKRIAAWMARGKVPIAVEATAILLEAVLADPQRASAHAPALEVDAHDDMRLRLMYSMAVLRMVNGIVDPAQKGRTAASVGDLAAGLNLPRFFVDLRHEATHKALPALPALRVAAARALDWLREAYWEAQEARLREGPRAFRQLLASYAEKQAAALDEEAEAVPPGLGPGEKREAKERMRRAKKEKRRLAGRALRALLRAVSPDDLKGQLVPLLLDGGFLAPAPPEPSQGVPGAPPPPPPSSSSEEPSGAARFKRCAAVMGPALEAMGEQWPQLAPTVLLLAVQRIAEEPPPPGAFPPQAPGTPARGGSGAGASGPPGADRWDQLVRWTQRLLNGSGGGEAAGAGLAPARRGRPRAVARAALQLCLDFPNAWTRRVVRACAAAVRPAGGDGERLRKVAAALEAAMDAALARRGGGGGPAEDGEGGAGPSLEELEAFAARLAARRAPPQPAAAAAPASAPASPSPMEEDAVGEPAAAAAAGGPAAPGASPPPGPGAAAWTGYAVWRRRKRGKALTRYPQVPCSLGALPHAPYPPLDLPAFLDDPFCGYVLVPCERGEEDDEAGFLFESAGRRRGEHPPPAKRPRGGAPGSARHPPGPPHGQQRPHQPALAEGAPAASSAAAAEEEDGQEDGRAAAPPVDIEALAARVPFFL